MTDFDANEDPLRLTRHRKDDPYVPAELRPRFAPRARQLAYGRCFTRNESGANRIQSTLDARSRRGSSLRVSAGWARGRARIPAASQPAPVDQVPRASTPDLQADVATLRYLDVCLVLATAPFVLIGGLPIARLPDRRRSPGC